MRIAAELAGRTVGPRVHEIDARWLMAHAAALGEAAPEYFDTCRSEGILGHPLFPVCYEWPLALDLRVGLIPDDVALRGVHATHDLRIHRPPRAGDRLRTTAAVTLVQPRKPGAYVVARFETVDDRGQPVSTTDYGTLYLGVTCEPARAAGAPADDPTDPGDGQERWAVPVAVSATLGHLYSECARIWNPIHTDRAVARGAGLPDPILHGTATLGLAVSEVIRQEGAGAATPVRRVGCRFGAMVRMPSTVTVRGLGLTETPEGRWLRFEAVSDSGRAVRGGRLLLAG